MRKIKNAVFFKLTFYIFSFTKNSEHIVMNQMFYCEIEAKKAVFQQGDNITVHP